MPRLPFADPATMTPECKQLLEVNRFNIYRMLPRLGAKASSAFIALGDAILRDGKLDRVLREVAILRVGHLSRASYEVHQHTRIAKRYGMSEELLAAIEEGPSAEGLTPRQSLVLRYTDEVVTQVKSSDALFDEVRHAFDEDQAAELTLVIGFYMMVCRFLENLEIPIEEA